MWSMLREFSSQHVFDFISLFGILAALLVGARQNYLNAKALRAQAFLSLHSLELLGRGQQGIDGIEAIASLLQFSNFADFEREVHEEQRKAIFDAVSFLNFVAVLGEEGYLDIQDAWEVYFMAYRRAYENLLPWWLAEHRKYQPHVFPSFERASLVIGEISQDEIDAHTRANLRRWTFIYQRSSHLTKSRVSSALARSSLFIGNHRPKHHSLRKSNS